MKGASAHKRMDLRGGTERVFYQTDVGAMDNVVGDLRTGVLDDPDDAAELQSKISWLLEPARWALLSQQARRIAEERTWDNYFEEFDQALISLCSRGEEAHV
jgi:glycosyltransferase involved in cell wall biosynthesis